MHYRNFLFLVSLGSVIPFVACSSSPDASGTFTVSPTKADVETCRGLQLTATPTDGVTWSTDVGTVDAKGLYRAPISTPSSGTASVVAKRGTLSATASLRIATAFPGATTELPNATTATADQVRSVAAHGNRAYAMMQDKPTSGTVHVARSDDGGKTWAPAIDAGAFLLSATSIAIDAGSDDVVYIALSGDVENGSSSSVQLLTSTDGGKTFSSKLLFSGTNSEVSNADVVSPAAGTVIVSAPVAWQDGEGGQGTHLALFRDTARGTGFGGLVDANLGYGQKWAAGQLFRLASGHLVETGNRRGGPHFVTNGTGKTCVAFVDTNLLGVDDVARIACSTDGGGTWEAPHVIATGPINTVSRARIAMSKDGTFLGATFNDNRSNPEELATAFSVSVDGGQTWSPKTTLPDLAGDTGPSKVVDSEPIIDSAGALWMARTADGVEIQLDKTCDRGKTFSGSLVLDASQAMSRSFFFESNAGLFLGARRESSGGADHLALIRLSPTGL